MGNEEQNVVEEVKEKENKATSRPKINKKIIMIAVPIGVVLFILIFMLANQLAAGKTIQSKNQSADVSPDEIINIQRGLEHIADSSNINNNHTGNESKEYVDSILNKPENEETIAEASDSEEELNPDAMLNRSEDPQIDINIKPSGDSLSGLPKKPNQNSNENEISMMVYSRNQKISNANEQNAQRIDRGDESNKNQENGDERVNREIIRRLTENPVETVIYNDIPPIRIFEGECLEGIIVNRIETGVSECPVVANLVKDFYDNDQKYVVIPAGSRIVGTAGTVTRIDQARLIITFHRIILPNGQSIYINRREAKALAADGTMGVVSKVNEHLFKRYGSALLFGVLDGLGALAQNKLKQTSSTSFMVDKMSSNFEQINNHIFQQYSNIVPTITVAAGHKVKIYISEDILISPYMPIKERGYAK